MARAVRGSADVMRPFSLQGEFGAFLGGATFGLPQRSALMPAFPRECKRSL